MMGDQGKGREGIRERWLPTLKRLCQGEHLERCGFVTFEPESLSPAITARTLAPVHCI